MVRDKGTLFTPISIGKMELRNRIIMPAMATNYGSSTGEVTQRNIDYYVARAKAGPGMIIVEVTSIDEGGKPLKNNLGNDDDRFKPGLTQLARAIKEHEVRACVQVHHGGRVCRSAITGKPVVAPSAIATWNGEMPHELTVAEIEDLINKYAQAAKRGKDCGFDAVELHFAHGYLGAQFLSPLINKRKDKYGGDLENRARFCLEAIAATRSLVGNDYPLLARLNADEHIQGGITIYDAVTIAQMFEGAGIDALNVSAGYRAFSEEGYITCGVPTSLAPMSMPRGCFLHLAEVVRKHVSIPVITVGRINDLSLAEKVIAEGKADIVACGRAFMSDPDFIPKWLAGRDEEIRSCIACNVCQTCLSNQEPVRCAINAEMGREREFAIAPAAKKRKVLVVGGGPAGMEAARVCAMRGHKVILVEKEDRLGGNLIPASRPDFKGEIDTLTKFLITQVKKQGVKVELNTTVDANYVMKIAPDVVILATGAKPSKPAIKGIDKSIVTDAAEVLTGKVNVGYEAVVIGGGRIGCEVAAYLAQQDKKITVVEIRSTDFGPNQGLAPDEQPIMRRWLLFDLWPSLGIRVIGQATAKEITDEGVIVTKNDSPDRIIKCDKVIFAMGMTSENVLQDELKDKIAECYQIGDSKEPRTIMEAIHEGAEVARKI